MIQKSVFDDYKESPKYKKNEGDKGYKQYIDTEIKRANSCYIQMINDNKERKKNQDIKERDDCELVKRLAWLEHRRWNAFMRSKGFQCSGKMEYEKYIEKTHSHKNLKLKLHPCLVECDDKGMRVDSENEYLKTLLYDMLDCTTVYVRKDFPEKDDFKTYDYPIEDIKED